MRFAIPVVFAFMGWYWCGQIMAIRRCSAIGGTSVAGIGRFVCVKEKLPVIELKSPGVSGVDYPSTRDQLKKR